jgi:hypothetical protein
MLSNQRINISKVVNLFLPTPHKIDKNKKKQLKSYPVRVSKQIRKSDLYKKEHKLNSVAISKNKINQYFASFSVEEDIQELQKSACKKLNARKLNPTNVRYTFCFFHLTTIISVLYF